MLTCNIFLIFIQALGCIFYAICYLTHPFQDCGPLGILNGKIPPRPLDCTDQIPQNCDVLIERMLDVSYICHLLVLFFCIFSNALCRFVACSWILKLGPQPKNY